MRQLFGQVRVTAHTEVVSFLSDLQDNGALHHIEESLGGGGGQFALRLELSSVFGKRRAKRGANVHDGGGILHAGQSGAHKGGGSEKQVVAVTRAARLDDVLHGTGLAEIRAWR